MIKSHCRKSHEFSLENTGYRNDDTRYCISCKRASARKSQQKWRANNPDRSKINWTVSSRKQTLKKYSITKEEYGVLFGKQEGLCAICAQPSKKKKLAVDHNHKTGLIRGLLCSGCNVGLGHFQDVSTLLQKAQIYLENVDLTE